MVGNQINLGQILQRIRERKPLIHHITNQVTISECANITLHLGALPVMAHALEEVEEMVSIAGALVLNIGTLTSEQVEAMIKAGQKANRLNIPVVLDPVGVGATKLRTSAAQDILQHVRLAVVKGNRAEIAVLSGLDAEVRGVESGEVEGDWVEGAKQLAQKYRATVVATGVEDLITDGERLAWIENGHPLMGSIVGTGCMAASTIGAYTAVEEDGFTAATAAISAFGVAGQLAAEGKISGPGTFRRKFFDTVAHLSGEQIDSLGRVRIE